MENSPESKVLVIASDIAGMVLKLQENQLKVLEVVAMLITQNPRMMAFNNDNVAQTRDIMDFGVQITRQLLM